MPTLTNAVLTIGTFDGVHLGHQRILQRLIEKAKQIKGESVLLTFEPHPRAVVFPNDKSLKLLTTIDEKIQLLSHIGIDHLVIMPFTVELSQVSPKYYVEKILIEQLQAKFIIIGFDHRFGLNREGDINLLWEYAEKGLFGIEEIEKQEIKNAKISSTRIRECVHEGALSEANALLGYPYMLSGRVTAGRRWATGMGYPTANITIDNIQKLVPKPGTYAASCVLQDTSYRGMVYIGHSATLDPNKPLTIEMNIFHQFEQDFYGEELTIQLLKYIREDGTFDSKAELQWNIQEDRQVCERFFEWQDQVEIPMVSSVVLNWNGEKLLPEFLPSGMNGAQVYSHQLAVIDNASTDGSVDWIKNILGNSVKLITLSENLGFAGGYNKGLQQVYSKYIALVNSDVLCTDGWLDPIIERMEADDTIGAAMPKLLSYRQQDSFEYAGAAGGWLDRLGYPFCRGRVLETVEEDHGQYDDIQSIFWATGAALVIRRELFEQLRGFDTDFFAHMEEIDLCWRLQRLGYRVEVLPQSRVFHLGAATLSKVSLRKLFLNFRNNWWMLLKNENPKRLWNLVIQRLLLEKAAMLQYLVKGDGKASWTILKAHVAVLNSIKTIRNKREEFSYLANRYQRTGTSSKIKGRSHRAIVWQYFVKKNRKFLSIEK